MAFKDKNQFETSDREDEFRTGAFPLESADMESPDEESPDDEEETELSEEELAEEAEEFNRAEGVPEFPDDEEGEKTPVISRPRWLARISSCLMGTFLAAAIAGPLVDSVPASQQARMFLIYFLVLAPLLSFVWHWFFFLHPQRLAKKMQDWQANPVDRQMTPADQQIPADQQTHPIGSEPIHPK